MLNHIKRYFIDASLKKKLVIVYTLFTVAIVLAIGMSTYYLAVNRLEKNEKAFVSNNLESTNFVLDSILDTYMLKSDALFANTLLQKAISEDYTDSTLYDITMTYQNEIYKSITPIMQDVVAHQLAYRSFWVQKSQVKIYIKNKTFPVDGGAIWSYDTLNKEPWLAEVEALNGKAMWRGLFEEKGVHYISINRVFKNFDSLENIGLIVLQIPESQIKNLISLNLNNNQMKLYLMDYEQHIIESKNDNIQVGKDELISLLNHEAESIKDDLFINEKGEKYIVVRRTSAVNGWHLIGLYPYDQIENSMKSIKQAIIFTLILSIVIAILITVFMAHTNTRRLGKIMNKIEVIKGDRKAILEPIEGRDEIGKLDALFNEMMTEINTLIEKEINLERKGNQLKLELLQANINPHMIYNTLATIKWKTEQLGAKEIEQVVEKLIWFFKYYLNAGEMVATIGQELELIRNYIDILKFTYHLDLDEHITVDDAIKDAATLHLILQPIVENAILHGIRPSKKKGILAIRIEQVGGQIEMSIEDNGVGMSESVVDKLLKGEYSTSLNGYGMKNVIERIKLYFGSSYGVSIDSQIGVGTKITVRIPVLNENELPEQGDVI